MDSPIIETERPEAIGRYSIMRELGRGGMGVVYLARDSKLDRRLALKVLPPHVAEDPERVRRFEQEARILAAIDHPNIATIYSLEESEQYHFLTMEYVSGETLAARLQRGSLPVEDALRVGQQVASALEGAHRQGMVHCDLKPANVMLTCGPRAKVLDFGLARVIERESSSAADGDTRSGSLGAILGTPGYASPEQLRGDDVDHRADVWAFGCVLYESLAGHPAFRGDTAADRMAATLTHPPDWQALPPTTPQSVHDLLRRCLETPVTHRIRSMARVRGAIEDILAGRPSSSPPTPTVTESVPTPHNLPLQLASFVGRGGDRRDVARALEQHRLVTLTGPGGSGKTRLAIEIAHDRLTAYPDGVRLASLASVREGAQVAVTVLTALELLEEPHRRVLETLLDHLRSRRLLIILDNCEHLRGACAELSESVLAHASDVRILATSREALGLTGEFVHRVPPLPLPDSRDSMTLEELRGVESVRLFVERAAAAGSGFQLTMTNASDVSRICRRLDGIPLAIELAAARVRALPLPEIAKRLHDRFDLLSVGPSTSEPRHQTLRALIDWSHDLLSGQEQTLFSRLGVFAGGWSLDAAESVCTDDGTDRREVLTLLSRLVERSLVEVRAAERRGGLPRYRMLETVRAYARDRRDRGRFHEVELRHLEYFAELAKRGFAGLTGPDQATWVAELEENHANLRAALEMAGESAVPIGLAMAGHLGRYWYARGRWSEGRALLTSFLRRPEAATRDGKRARALNWAGWLMYWQGDFEEANTVLMESLSISRELDDSMSIAEALNNLGAVQTARGNWDDARAHHEEALAIRRRSADRRAIAVSVHNLGETFLSQGEYEMARQSLEESLTLFREVGHAMGATDSLSCLGLVAERTGDLDRAMAYHEESLASRRERNEPVGTSESLRNLGRLAARRGDYARAHDLLTESLFIRRKLGDRMDIAAGLEALGELAARQNQATRAARILGAADALRDRIHAPIWAGDRVQVDRAVARVREALGRDFEREWCTGRALSDEAALDLALSESD